jgi:general secretion pathway protein D
MLTAGGPLGHLLPAELTPPVAYAPLNALIVQGPMEAIEEFRKLVEQLDVRVPQVMVEAQFVEMRVDDARQFGINWSWIGGETGIDVTGMASGGNVGISFVKGRFTALLQSLLDTSRARIINAPRLATMNMQRVAFIISRTFFYFTSDTVVQTPTFAGSQVFTTSRLNALPVVTTFEIMPQVNGDDSITVDVSTIISDVAGFITGPNGDKIPEPTATSLPTRLRVQNGETIVMGGFVRKNVSETKHKVPLLSDIPIIGKLLFTGSSFTQSYSELLIFLTAHIMEESDSAAAREEGGSSFMMMPLGQ